jgi:hypothetical protein
MKRALCPYLVEEWGGTLADAFLFFGYFYNMFQVPAVTRRRVQLP